MPKQSPLKTTFWSVVSKGLLWLPDQRIGFPVPTDRRTLFQEGRSGFFLCLSARAIINRLFA